jgi:hypothetical protein
MGVKERLIEFVEYKKKIGKFSNAEFCRSIGVSDQYINSMRNSIPPDKIKKISEIYTELSIDWLLIGSGPMLKAEKADQEQVKEESSDDYKSDLIISLKKQVKLLEDQLEGKDEVIKVLKLRVDEQDETIKAFRKAVNSSDDSEMESLQKGSG